MDSDATYAVNHDSDRDMQSKTSGSNIWFKLPRLWPSREVETNHERLQPRLVVEKSFEDHPRPRSMAWSTLSPISPIEDKGSQESMKGAAN